ncbi:unnamed protein product [Owenia fusiformis]|uniref:Uncharacterized protein n=1 Tax=Owenia fusiformis TaxID=6347 RepID=A0A8J1UUE3_OWEFU|nr:unnamed protein product [Owenia fusiformis]
MRRYDESRCLYGTVLAVLLMIVLMSVATSSYPQKTMNKHIRKRASSLLEIAACESLSEGELKRRLGTAFDDSRMKLRKGRKNRKRKKQRKNKQSRKGKKHNRKEDVLDSSDEIDRTAAQLIGYEEAAFTDATSVDVDDTSLFTDSVETEPYYTPVEYKRSFKGTEATMYHNNRTHREDKRIEKRSISALEPWQCKMKTEWVKMKKGVFPPYIQTGRCLSTECMGGVMYECVPKKYVIKILKRDPNSCNPLPNLNSSTTYEESWKISRHDVTVCCECRRKRKIRRKKGWDER